MNAAAHIVVRGWVQGVGFRYFVQHHAQQLGVSGWVKNLPSGDVEIEAEGEKASLNELIDLVEHGPRSAVVFNAEVEWKEYRQLFKRFEITH